MDHAKEISTLNGLIETSMDGEEGFRLAAEGITDRHVKEVFQQYSAQRAQFVRELQKQVEKVGGAPETSGSLAGTLRRGWLNIKTVVIGKDDRAIIAEAERGEDAAKAAFERAILEPLPPAILAVVRHMLAQVREGHDTVRAIEKAGAR